jgi:predicted regulator of Ras-like GTPase activity (Roadblock/LC7/MglB family)
MSAELQSVLQEVRADLGDDFVASGIVGQDGVALATETAGQSFNSDLASAQFSMVMKMSERLSDRLSLGKLQENQLATDALLALSRPIGDGNFYWLLVAQPQTNLGLLRAVMDQYELRVFGAIPS